MATDDREVVRCRVRDKAERAGRGTVDLYGNSVCGGSSATILNGPPLPAAIFIGKAITMK
jgi:hypothetical protein